MLSTFYQQKNTFLNQKPFNNYKIPILKPFTNNVNYLYGDLACH